VISLPQGGRLGTLKSHIVFLQRALEEDSDCRGALYQDCSHTDGTCTNKQTVILQCLICSYRQIWDIQKGKIKGLLF